MNLWKGKNVSAHKWIPKKKKKKIQLHQKKNQFTQKDMWKGNPQMNKIFTVYISEKQNATVIRENEKLIKILC